MTGPQSWRLEVSSPAQRDLARLPHRIAAAVVEYLTQTLPENPKRMTKPLNGDLAGYRSARRGDYRILIRLRENDQVIEVIRIDHRAHVYRPR